MPTRYELSIAPDLGAASFLGQERIEIEVEVPTSSIVCNAAELYIANAKLSWPGGSPAPVELAVSLDEDLERVTFTAPHQILPGPCVLECDFQGVLNDKLRGFYRSNFRDTEGNEQTVAVTQFESTDARRAFPCWDEPDRKAVFSVTLEVDADLLAISNGAELSSTALPGGKRRVGLRGHDPDVDLPRRLRRRPHGRDRARRGRTGRHFASSTPPAKRG